MRIGLSGNAAWAAGIAASSAMHAASALRSVFLIFVSLSF
jgi:hypothetical protein